MNPGAVFFGPAKKTTVNLPVNHNVPGIVHIHLSMEVIIVQKGILNLLIQFSALNATQITFDQVGRGCRVWKLHVWCLVSAMKLKLYLSMSTYSVKCVEMI